jgi:hypothetical protein
MHSSKRWYDAHEEFAVLLESLKTAKAGNRDRIVAGVLEIITTDAPILLEKYLLDFPLDQKRRRWYDQDPYLWLMVNGLEHAGVKLLQKVTAFMSGKEKNEGTKKKKTLRHSDKLSASLRSGQAQKKRMQKEKTSVRKVGKRK